MNTKLFIESVCNNIEFVRWHFHVLDHEEYAIFHETSNKWMGMMAGSMDIACSSPLIAGPMDDFCEHEWIMAISLFQNE